MTSTPVTDELRGALRERTIVINRILIPIVMYPFLFWLIYTAFTFVSGQTADLPSRVALIGLPVGHAALRHEITSQKNIQILEPLDPLQDLRRGRLDAMVAFNRAGADDFHVRITYDESRDVSTQAKARIEDLFTRYRQQVLQDAAGGLGISAEQFQAFYVDTRNVSSDRQMGQFILGLMLPVMLVVMMTIGGFYPAVDSTAGERENSTWETIMTTGTSRSNIVIAKYLYVATMSTGAALLNVSAMTLSMRTILASLGRGTSQFVYQIPLRALPLIAVGTVLMALFVAAGMMILASFARNFKEGQSMVSPFYILVILPVMFLQSPGAELSPKLALFPVVNVTLMFREAIMGVYKWPLIGMTIAVEAVCVFVALKIALIVMSYEEVVTGSYSGSFGKFFRERMLRGKQRQNEI